MARALHCNRLVATRHRRGFTLIEMMIVVVIVGILAALAVVGYRKMVQSSHISEATSMVTNIRVAQEAYHAESQQYANISPAWTTGSPGAPGFTTYPAASPVRTVLTGWGAACGAQCATGMDWTMLPLHVDGPVMFGYSTVAGAANTNPVASFLVNGKAVALPQPSTVDWYVVGATCDLDGNGAPNTSVYGGVWTNQIFVDSEE